MAKKKEKKLVTHWGRIFGGMLVLALIYLFWWAFHVGSQPIFMQKAAQTVLRVAYPGPGPENVSAATEEELAPVVPVRAEQPDDEDVDIRDILTPGEYERLEELERMKASEGIVDVPNEEIILLE